MKEYEITITETLSMTVTVEAENEQQAKGIVSDRWKNGDYILDADHFKGVDFSVKRNQRSHDYER
ncbi:MAG: DpnD/PcfM family protein [Clostridia bacterium]|nr:DpnD/PcfM family protein [Clostridia bacterium]